MKRRNIADLGHSPGLIQLLAEHLPGFTAGILVSVVWILTSLGCPPAAIAWTTFDGVSIPVPPAEHPRLYLRARDLADLQRRTTHPVLKPIWFEGPPGDYTLQGKAR